MFPFAIMFPPRYLKHFTPSNFSQSKLTTHLTCLSTLLHLITLLSFTYTNTKVLHHASGHRHQLSIWHCSLTSSHKNHVTSPSIMITKWIALTISCHFTPPIHHYHTTEVLLHIFLNNFLAQFYVESSSCFILASLEELSTVRVINLF